MSELSSTLTRNEIQRIAEKDDFHIAPYRADGETFGTPTWIWVVEVEGDLYVRAYYGTKSRWYNSAKEQKAGKIEAAGMKKKVRFELISDNDLNNKIDNAYRAKYSGSPYLNHMIGSTSKAATVKILAGE